MVKAPMEWDLCLNPKYINPELLGPAFERPHPQEAHDGLFARRAHDGRTNIYPVKGATIRPLAAGLY